MQLFSAFAIHLLAAVTSIAAPVDSTESLPNHFGLFMYSVDGSIVNETLYARSVPCFGNTTSSISTVQADPKYGTYGAYTWGIGPSGHLFAYKDGRIATCSPSCIGGKDSFGGTSQVTVQTWNSYHNGSMQTEIPICGISQDTCLDTFSLQCSSGDHPLTWSFCGSDVDATGQPYTLDILSWSTVIAPGCREVEMRIVELPKNWGNQTYNHTIINCSAIASI